MFQESENPQDHADHNPARCDYARIWLTQQFVKGTHAEHVAKLSTMDIVAVGVKTVVYSAAIELTDLYANFNLTLDQLYDFSEYLRLYLINERHVGNNHRMADKAHLN